MAFAITQVDSLLAASRTFTADVIKRSGREDTFAGGWLRGIQRATVQRGFDPSPVRNTLTLARNPVTDAHQALVHAVETAPTMPIGTRQALTGALDELQGRILSAYDDILDAKTAPAMVDVAHTIDRLGVQVRHLADSVELTTARATEHAALPG